MELCVLSNERGFRFFIETGALCGSFFSVSGSLQPYHKETVTLCVAPATDTRFIGFRAH